MKQDIEEESKWRTEALVALDAWARHSTARGPLFEPGPQDFSKKMGRGSDYVDPDRCLARLVEDELNARSASQVATPRHPLRMLLRHVHDDDGRRSEAKDPSRFPWGRALPGLSDPEVTYILGMKPHHRAAGDYQEFVRALARRLAAQPVEVAIEIPGMAQAEEVAAGLLTKEQRGGGQ